jgi:integrase
MRMEEFDIVLNTGMLRSEQRALEWPAVSFWRNRILLDETKNGSNREIPLNKTCFNALETLYQKALKTMHADRPHNARVCQSNYGCDLKRLQGLV